MYDVESRKELKDYVLRGMNAEKLMLLASWELCGNIEINVDSGVGISCYFNCIEQVDMVDDEECNLVCFLQKYDDQILATSTIDTDMIDCIYGLENEDLPDNVLDIYILMEDQTAITISLVY